MKILNVMCGRGRGGLEQAALDYHHMLAAEGHEVTSAGAPDGWFRAALEPCAAFAPVRARGALRFAARWSLARAARALEARAVLCHGNRAMAAAAGLAALQVRIGVGHNVRFQRAYAGAHGLIAVSPDVARHAQDLGFAAERIRLVPNATRILSDAPRPPFRTPPVIAALARLHENKGLDVLLDAARLLADQGRGFRLVMGGAGPLRRALGAQAEALGLRVCFPGWVEDRTAFFAAADIFCLPSRVEPFGIALLEAMGSGLPVVAAATGGPASIVTPGRDGLLVPSEDAGALAASLGALLDDPSRARAVGEAARATVRTRYSPAAVAPRLSRAVMELEQAARARGSG